MSTASDTRESVPVPPVPITWDSVLTLVVRYLLGGMGLPVSTQRDTKAASFGLTPARTDCNVGPGIRILDHMRALASEKTGTTL
jgi:hypothetical protein